jgi:hypothetical protein
MVTRSDLRPNSGTHRAQGAISSSIREQVAEDRWPMLRHIARDHLRLERMASGHLALVLRERADWDGLDDLADELLRIVGGLITSRADSPVERVWTVRIGGEDFWLAFDDWQGRTELAARGARGDAILTAMLEAFGAHDR